MVYIKSILSAFFIAGGILTFSIGVFSRGLPDVVGPPAEEWKQTLHFENIGRLHLENRNGGLRIFPAEGNSVVVTAQIRIYLREQKQDDWESYQRKLLQVIRNGSELILVSEPGEIPSSVEIWIDYNIRIPQQCDLEIKNDNGNVWIEPGAGAIQIDGLNSDITVKRNDGKLDIHTLNGRIRAYGLKQDAVLHTVNGSIYCYMNGDNFLDVKTTNGLIVAHLKGPNRKKWHLQTQNGSVTAVLSNYDNIGFSAQTSRGKIKSDLPMIVEAGDIGAKEIKGIFRGHQSLNENNAKVLFIQTLNGNIWFTREKTPG